MKQIVITKEAYDLIRSRSLPDKVFIETGHPILDDTHQIIEVDDDVLWSILNNCEEDESFSDYILRTVGKGLSPNSN